MVGERIPDDDEDNVEVDAPQNGVRRNGVVTHTQPGNGSYTITHTRTHSRKDLEANTRRTSEKPHEKNDRKHTKKTEKRRNEASSF